MFQLLLLLHFICTWFMVGTVTFINACHYPLFNRVGEPSFAKYHEGHMSKTSLVVMPIMGVELLTAVLLVMGTRNQILARSLWINLGILLLIWAITAFWSAKCHESFKKQNYSESVQKNLLRSNHLRTLLWWIRAVLLSLALLDATFVIS